jgi:plastocyanin
MNRSAIVIGVFAAMILFPMSVGHTQQGDPAPQEDRVGFPEGYETFYTPFFTFDRPDNRQIRVVYANKAASTAKSGTPFPYGSVLVMETYRARTDSRGIVIRDAEGRFVRDTLNAIFVMRKERGFGEAYQRNRTGEWEYVAYRPDRSYNTPPQNSASCANCHLMAGIGRDWVFRANLFFERGSGSLPQGVIQHYLFTPGNIHVTAGTAVTWYNDDEVEHRIVVDGTEHASRAMRQGATYGLLFNRKGEYDYHCSIHPTMTGKVIVE